MDILIKDPMVWGSILIMPVVIIGLAVALKKLKDKSASKKAAD